MSRTELVKKVLAEVLKGRDNSFDIGDQGEGNIQVFFFMAYWNAPIQVELVNKLNAEGFALETWNVAGTHFGQVHVRLEVFDVQALLSIGLEIEGKRTVGSWNDQKVLEKYLVATRARKRCKHPKVRRVAGCEDCPDWDGCEHEKVRY